MKEIKKVRKAAKEIYSNTKETWTTAKGRNKYIKEKIMTTFGLIHLTEIPALMKDE